MKSASLKILGLNELIKASVFNNLAQVLWKQGKNREALKAAYQAVKLGGPLVDKYQKTLEEIQAGNAMINN